MSALCSMYLTCPFLKTYFCSFSLIEYNWDCPGGSVVRNLPASAGDARDAALIHGSGRSPGVRKDNPLQHSCLEKSMDSGAYSGGGLQSTGYQRIRYNWATEHEWACNYYISLLERNCFTMLCFTMTGISYMDPYIPSLLSLFPALPTVPRPTPLGTHRALSWAPCTLQKRPTSYSILRVVVHTCRSCSPNWSHSPLLPCGHKPLL